MSNRLRFGLLDNALDYLLSAAEHAKAGAPRNLKYSILHLFDGLELLLKARLEKEHWSLLFQDARQLSKDKRDEGDFKSVDFDTAIERLENVAGVQIEDDDKKHLTKLQKVRNRVRHFVIDMEVMEVRAKLACALHFAVKFLESELALSLDDAHVELQEQILRHLAEFDEFVKQRLKEIRTEFGEDVELRECPNCLVPAVHFLGGEPRCEYCRRVINAEDWASEIGEQLIGNCPECDNETLVFILYNNEQGGYFCTSCGFETQNEVSQCCQCGANFIGDDVMCDSCWTELVSKD